MHHKPHYSIVLSTGDHQALRDLLFTADSCENFAVLLCGVAAAGPTRRLLVREIITTPATGYRQRREDYLEISPAFLNQLIDRSLATGLSPVVAHSHPMSDGAHYSRADDIGESRLLPVLSDLLPDLLPSSLLLSRRSMAARRMEQGAFMPFKSVEVKGLESKIIGDETGEIPPGGEEFDRIIRAIGAQGHAAIGALKVGIVGVGGTGSAVAEQIVRLGVRDVILVDHDTVEASNLARMWGSRSGDAEGSPLKVDVVARHLKTIRPDGAVRTIGDSIVRQEIISQLKDRDLVFACTDNHLSRAILNRFAHQYLVPVVDMGIRVDARNGTVRAVGGRVTLVGEGLACLRCSRHIDADQIRAEITPPRERAALAREGYIQGVADPEPSVISLNGVVSSFAVTAGIGLFVNLVGSRPPIDQIVDMTNANVFGVEPRHDSGCDVCTAAGGLKGLGDSQVVSAYR